jgi:aspartate carbamoyltransferase catalytic subunit
MEEDRKKTKKSRKKQTQITLFFEVSVKTRLGINELFSIFSKNILRKKSKYH